MELAYLNVGSINARRQTIWLPSPLVVGHVSDLCVIVARDLNVVLRVISSVDYRVTDLNISVVVRVTNELSLGSVTVLRRSSVILVNLTRVICVEKCTYRNSYLQFTVSRVM